MLRPLLTCGCVLRALLRSSFCFCESDFPPLGNNGTGVGHIFAEPYAAVAELKDAPKEVSGSEGSDAKGDGSGDFNPKDMRSKLKRQRRAQRRREYHEAFYAALAEDKKKNAAQDQEKKEKLEKEAHEKAKLEEVLKELEQPGSEVRAFFLRAFVLRGAALRAFFLRVAALLAPASASLAPPRASSRLVRPPRG